MNEMMEGQRAERKNGMVQSEPVAVIPPPPLNSSSWTSVSAPDFTAANQPRWELYSRVKSWLSHRWMDLWMERCGQGVCQEGQGICANSQEMSGRILYTRYFMEGIPFTFIGHCSFRAFVSFQLEIGFGCSMVVPHRCSVYFISGVQWLSSLRKFSFPASLFFSFFFKFLCLFAPKSTPMPRHFVTGDIRDGVILP